MIGTVLLVVMSIVLAAVLYVAVTNFLLPARPGASVLGILIERTPDGSNWTLTVVTTPLGLAPSQLKLTLITPSGDTDLAKAFVDLDYAADGALFLGSENPTLTPGDRIVVDAARYPAFYQVLISDETSVVFSGTFV